METETIFEVKKYNEIIKISDTIKQMKTVSIKVEEHMLWISVSEFLLGLCYAYGIKPKLDSENHVLTIDPMIFNG
jgi:hypothetical protein